MDVGEKICVEITEKDIWYEARGIIVVTDWFGNRGYAGVELKIPGEKFDEWKNNMLQDYIEFGVRSVDYAEFDVVKHISYTTSNPHVHIHETEDLGILTSGKEPDNMDEIRADAKYYDFTRVVYA